MGGRVDPAQDPTAPVGVPDCARDILWRLPSFRRGIIEDAFELGDACYSDHIVDMPAVQALSPLGAVAERERNVLLEGGAAVVQGLEGQIRVAVGRVDPADLDVHVAPVDKAEPSSGGEFVVAAPNVSHPIVIQRDVADLELSEACRSSLPRLFERQKCLDKTTARRSSIET